MADSGSDSEREHEHEPSPSTTSQQILPLPQRASPPKRQRTDPDDLYAGIEASSSQPKISRHQAQPKTRALPGQAPLPTPPVSSRLLNQSQVQRSQPSQSQSSPSRRFQDLHLSQSGTQPPSSPTGIPRQKLTPQPQLFKQKHAQVQNDNSTIPDPTEDDNLLSDIDLLDPPSHLIRPNRYLGPASTWRSWTVEERTVVASLDRARATDLSIHLYNSFILRQKADATGTRKRRSRTGTSRADSSSRSRSRSRGRSKSLTRAKGKGRARAVDDEEIPNDDDDNRSDLRHSSQSPDKAYDPTSNTVDDTPFRPPRSWTAWPLIPKSVPRDPFLPHVVTSRHHSGDGYRRPPDLRPSAELEECLLALTTRFAKEMWEAREWESGATSDDKGSLYGSRDGERRSRKRRRKRANEDNEDVEMRDSNDKGGGNEIPTFSSQMFGNAISASPSSSSPTHITTSPPPTTIEPESRVHASSSSATNVDPNNEDGNTTGISDTDISHQPFDGDGDDDDDDDDDDSNTYSNSPPFHPHTQKPTFSSSDPKIHPLVLPSTRHTISQLDNLLSALHKSRASYHTRGRRRNTKHNNKNITTTTDEDTGESRSRTRNTNAAVGGSGGGGSGSGSKTVTGTRGANEIMGLAGLFFDRPTVERAKGRCRDLGLGVGFGFG